MAQFPNQRPQCWEFTRGESDEHRTRRLAIAHNHEVTDKHRDSETNMIWNDQRYIDQVVPAHFTDPTTFDNFNFRYQMYARQPVQCPIRNLSEVTDETPPLRYDIKRIAVDKPYHPVSTSNNYCPLPHLTPKGNKLQQECRPGENDSSCCNQSSLTRSGSSSMMSACSTVSTRASSSSISFGHGGDCCGVNDNIANKSNNNVNNNNNNDDDKELCSLVNDTNNCIVCTRHRDKNKSNEDILTIPFLDNVMKKGNIVNSCVQRKPNYLNESCRPGDLINANTNNNSNVAHRGSRYNHGLNFPDTNYDLDTLEASTFRPVKLFLEAYPIAKRSYSLACPNQEKSSTFLCRQMKSSPQFPCDRILPGERISSNVDDDRKNVVCRRVFRCDTSKTKENEYFDATDPLIECQVVTDTNHKPFKPGYGTYKIIGSKQYREHPQPNIIDNMVLPEHLRKFKEYQRRCPNLVRGLYDRSDSRFELVLPTNKSGTLLPSNPNPFCYARNTFRNGGWPGDEDDENRICDARHNNDDDVIHWQMPSFLSSH